MDMIHNRDSDDTDLAHATTTSIPQLAMFPGALTARHFPRLAFLSFWIHQTIVFWPAHDETNCVDIGQGEPGVACKAAIPDMRNLRTPTLGYLCQDGTLHFPFFFRLFPAGGPPAHFRQ